MMYLYNIISFILLPIYFIIIFIRLLIGKEDVNRVKERFAFGKKRKGEDFLIWIHAASVGESVAALNLIRSINKQFPQIRFLVTSWTASSAKMLTAKLPEIAVHQFLPIDNIIFVKKFLKNWRPDLGIFIESELWPCIINKGAKYSKLLLLNARLSDRSFKSWQKRKKFFTLIVKNFSKIIVQSEVDLRKFNDLILIDKYSNDLEKSVINLGNIKFANQKLEVDEKELAILANHLKDKQIVVFASTHPEDEKAIFPILHSLKWQFPNCYFIVIPRHPERLKSIIDNCNLFHLSCAAKSQNNLPVLNDDVYIVDKFGEMGLFFSLAAISFIGGSFKQGGHNILEAAYFANCIIFGPDMSKNTDIASDALKNNSAIQIKNSNDLYEKLQYLLTPSNAKELKGYQENALNFVNKNQSVIEDYLKVIEEYID